MSESPYDFDHEYPPDLVAEHEAIVDHGDSPEQWKTMRLMLMRWRGEREVSPWERAVYFALRAPHDVDAAPALSDADLAFLDFIADRAVASVRARRAG